MTIARSIVYWLVALLILPLAFFMLGCAARYSPEALQAMAPAAEYAEVCARPPIVDRNSRAFAHKMSLQRTLSDDDWEEFEQFAGNADFIYRYDPNAPEKTMSRLPWPYQNMACRTLSARQTPPLPEGMTALEISSEMREALVSALMDRASLYLRAPSKDERANEAKPNKNYVADGFVLGPYVDGRSPSERLEAAGQMLRDAIRFIAPKVPGPKDEQISIIDTKTGQVLGGMGAGATISWVPGGIFIADAMQNSDRVPKPTPEFSAGQGLGQMGSGLLQIGGGGTLIAGGTGMSATGIGAIAGVPTCTAGVMLAANGTITFIHGAQTLLIAVCNWHELDNAQPLAAAAPKDAAPSAPPPQANAAPAPPPAKPAPAAPAQAQKPAPVPAKPAAKPNTPSGGQTPAQGPKHYGSGKKLSPNTTEWVRCTGQVHHAISKTIHKALQRHATLKNVYKERDRRFVTQAIDKAAHNGYETWHRNYERQVAAWLTEKEYATPAEFETYLRHLYKTDNVLAPKFPNGL